MTSSPATPGWSRVDQLNAVLAGASVSFLKLTSLVTYAATVSSVTANKQIVINSPNGGGSMTFPLTPMDSAVLLPIGILN